MAKKDELKQQEQGLEEVNETLSTAGLWIEKNASLISWVVLGVVALVLAIFAIKQYVYEPKGQEASEENAKAVVYFMADDFEHALRGDDADCIGFEQIADDYSHHQEGKLAALYAGICHYELGDLDAAASYLSKFSADDVMISAAASQKLGDVYVELQSYDKAVSAFKSAAKSGNELIAPMSLKKLGIVYLELGKKADAKKAFEQIKSDYPQSTEAQDIDKYIAIAQ